MVVQTSVPQNVAQFQHVGVAKIQRSVKKFDVFRLHITRRVVELLDPMLHSLLPARVTVPELQAMKRLLIVLFMLATATGCQWGLFRRNNSTPCASSGMMYESTPCEDGGAYLVPPQPGP